MSQFWAQPGATIGTVLVAIATAGSMLLVFSFGGLGYTGIGDVLLGFFVIVTGIGGILLWPGLLLLNLAAFAPGTMTASDRGRARAVVLSIDIVALVALAVLVLGRLGGAS